MGTEILFTPIKIGNTEIKNRIATAPMNLGMRRTPEPSEEEIIYYAARAKGGTGLIIQACVFGSKLSWENVGNQQMLRLYEPGHVYGYTRFTDVVHEHGAKAFVQFTPGFGKHHMYAPWPAMAPSPIPEPDVKEMDIFERYAPVMLTGLPQMVPREMTIEEIEQVQEEYTESLRLVIQAGFDGMEIHAPHGYLLHQFLSPIQNQRTDRYGGSLENRARFLTELAQKAREKYPGFPMGVRLSAEECLPGGFELDQTAQVIKWLEEIGMDYIQLSDGSGSDTNMFTDQRDNLKLIEKAAKLKKDMKIPLICPQVQTPSVCAEAIETGKFDLMSMGRPLLADPDWANKVKAGKEDEINHCRRCQLCQIAVFTMHGARCAYNPNCGNELYMPEYWPKKRTIGLPPYAKYLAKEKIDKSKLGEKERELLED